MPLRPLGGGAAAPGSNRTFAASTYPVRTPRYWSRYSTRYQSPSRPITRTVAPAGSVASGVRVESGNRYIGEALASTPVPVLCWPRAAVAAAITSAIAHTARRQNWMRIPRFYLSPGFRRPP
jgi:hypothetical protein